MSRKVGNQFKVLKWEGDVRPLSETLGKLLPCLIFGLGACGMAAVHPNSVVEQAVQLSVPTIST